MTETKNQTGTKKKLLIPVIVLLLLCVGMTGAVYAYSSSVSNSGNTVDADYLSIDLRNGSASDRVAVENPGALVFTDHYTYANFASKQDQVDAEATTAKIFQYQLKVSSDTTYSTIKVTSEDIAGVMDNVLKAGNPAVTVADIFKIYVNVNDTLVGAKELKAAASSDAIFPVVKDQETTNFDVFVFLVAMDNGVAQTTPGATAKTSVRDASDVAAQNDQNAEYFKNLFSGNDYKFTMTFTADSEGLPESEHGHTLVLTPVWNDNPTVTVTATATCSSCSGNIAVVLGAIQHYTVTEPTCNTTGTEHYWVTATCDGVEFILTHDVTLPALAA